jgi:hypothetical protein
MCCIFWGRSLALAREVTRPSVLLHLANPKARWLPYTQYDAIVIANRGHVMLPSQKASFQIQHCLLTCLSNFSKTLHRAAPILAICVLWFTIDSSHGQTSANAAGSSQSSKSCDGQMPPQKSSQQAMNKATSTDSDSAQSGSDAATEHLKLSMKGASEAPDPQGQFCSRERPDQSTKRPPVASPEAQGAVQSNQPGAPPPVAEVTAGELTIRANGQDFATVLDAVRSATGITIEMPAVNQPEPVFMTMGPVSTRDALVALLEGTKYNYVIVGSQENAQLVKRVILSERTSQVSMPLVASAGEASSAPQPELYGGQGVHEDAEAQNAEPPAPAPPPTPPAVAPSSVPTGVNIQQLAAQSNKTPGQILDELQKRQMQVLDDQNAQQPPQ